MKKRILPFLFTATSALVSLHLVPSLVYAGLSKYLCSGLQDQDNDGRVSFKDYEETVKNLPLLLEGFGDCLPAVEVCVNSY